MASSRRSRRTPRVFEWVAVRWMSTDVLSWKLAGFIRPRGTCSTDVSTATQCARTLYWQHPLQFKTNLLAWALTRWCVQVCTEYSMFSKRNWLVRFNVGGPHFCFPPMPFVLHYFMSGVCLLRNLIQLLKYNVSLSYTAEHQKTRLYIDMSFLFLHLSSKWSQFQFDNYNPEHVVCVSYTIQRCLKFFESLTCAYFY